MPAPAQNQPEPDDKIAKVVTRVRQLIQLSSSSNESEAMRAALQAAKLIRKYGLDVLNTHEINRIYADAKAEGDKILKAAQQQAALMAHDPDDDEDDPFARTGYAAANPSAYAGSPFPPFSPSWSSPPPPAPSPAPSPPAPQSKPMTVAVPIGSAKFAAKCKQCGRQIDVGEPALWLKSNPASGIVGGLWCPTTSCYADWQAGLPPRTGNSGSVSGFTPGGWGGP